MSDTEKNNEQVGSATSNGSSANSQQRRRKRTRRAGRHARREAQALEQMPTPKITRDEFTGLKVAELREKAEALGVEHKGLKKDPLIDAVFEAAYKAEEAEMQASYLAKRAQEEAERAAAKAEAERAEAESFIEVTGLLDIRPDGYGFLRVDGYLPGENDVYVGSSVIRRNGLRRGDIVTGVTKRAPEQPEGQQKRRNNEKNSSIQRIDSVNGIPLEENSRRPRFSDLTPIFPDQRLLMEHGPQFITARTIDLCAPIGKGQRGLIVSPPKAGKTVILKDIAAAISANNPDVHLMCLLVDERPEEVTDMERSIKGEVVSSTFDMPSENHIAVAELVIERARRLVELGKDVVILLDSITRLARAYNLAQPASGRILSGGVDSTALYPPKKFFGAARNIEGGGSLTILATALVDTGSKMDEVIFEEFKGTGNMELRLDRSLADKRIFPAIDVVASGTRKEELLLDPQEAPFIWGVRRILANLNNSERAMEMLIKGLKQTNSNQEFLVKTAKKAQQDKASGQNEV